MSAEAFHGVMSRSTAQGIVRTVQSEERSFFYNPMWNHFGDHGPSPPGTAKRSQTTFASTPDRTVALSCAPACGHVRLLMGNGRRRLTARMEQDVHMQSQACTAATSSSGR